MKGIVLAVRNSVENSDGSVRVNDARLQSCLDDGTPDIGSLWELCMYFEFDREETADGIAGWLGDPAGQRILDCACGSGFPALELARRGYDITCTDGSELMLRHFRRNARTDGLDIEPELLLWAELPKHYAGQFDVVMNRGGGNYKYAGAWESERLPDRGAMAEAIGQWVACVRPGGRFYIDIAAEHDADPADSGEAGESGHPTLLIGDHRVDITERISVDRARGIRTWHSRLTVDGSVHEFRRLSHSIDHEELTRILKECGLVDIRRTEIVGEHYDIFTAIRP